MEVLHSSPTTLDSDLDRETVAVEHDLVLMLISLLAPSLEGSRLIKPMGDGILVNEEEEEDFFLCLLFSRSAPRLLYGLLPRRIEWIGDEGVTSL